MVFWLGLVVAILSFGASYGPIPGALKAKYPRIRSRQFDVASAVVFVLGCLLAVIGHSSDIRESRSISEEIERLQTTVQQVEATADILVTASWSDGDGPSG